MASGGTWSVWRRRWMTAVWVCLLVAVFLLPYAQLPWWPFPASTAGLIALGALRWRGRVLQRLGLPRTRRSLLGTGALLLVLWAAFAYGLVPAVAAARGLALEPWSALAVSEFAFQALNEEIVLGWLIVATLARRTGRPVLVAAGVAVLFAVLHYALYRYGELGVSLLPLTLLSLVAVGAIRNGALLLAGHIGLAWALHAAWNLVMFSGWWHVTAGDDVLSEPQVLDAFLSYPPMAVALGVAGFALLIGLGRRGPAPSAPAVSGQRGAA